MYHLRFVRKLKFCERRNTLYPEFLFKSLIAPGKKPLHEAIVAAKDMADLEFLGASASGHWLIVRAWHVIEFSLDSRTSRTKTFVLER